jgi:hypothetical protein
MQEYINKQIFQRELSNAISRLNMLVKYAAIQRIDLSIFPVLEKQGSVECGVLSYQLKK